jgi:hypothetical protein
VTAASFSGPRLLALTAGFILLALLNTGGYRYGASDHAFYVPAVVQHTDARLFPRDRDVLEAESRFMVFDEIMALALRVTPLPVPSVFLLAYVLMLAGVAAATWAFGHTMYASGWTAAALVLAMSLRHRIAKTGVNTLESNFHPRVLAFAAGVAALAACLKYRWGLAVLLAAIAVPLHPTTGLWFALTVAVTIGVAEPRSRLTLLALGVLAGSAAVWAVTAGPLEGRLVVMEPEWLAAIERKDYLFPTEWSVATWAMNLAYPVAIGGLFLLRRRAGAATRAEAGVIAATFVLFLGFAGSLPFSDARIALAVQLQVPRVLWVLDFVATALLVWWVVEGPWGARATGVPRRWAVALVAVLALARGAFVTFVERHGDPLLTIDVPDDDWGRAMRWLRSETPVDAFVLADPGHLWKYGTSVRMAAERDVYLEEVKDSALAMYSRDLARRVVTRIGRTNGFPEMTPDQVRELARVEGVDFLVTEAALDLPVAFRSGRMVVYELRGPPGSN